MLRAISSILIFALAAPSHEQSTQSTPLSPCPNLFSYEPAASEPGRWYGVINLSTDVKLDSFRLNIVLDNKADLLGNELGEVSTKNNMDFKIFAEKEVQVGPFDPIRFFVQYNPLLKVPKIQVIKLNGKEVCNAKNSPSTANKPTPVPLIITTPEPKPAENVAKPDDAGGYGGIPLPYTGVKVVDYSFTENTQKKQTPTCGKVRIGVASINALVVNGNVAQEAHWPWHVAMYIANRVTTIDLMYHCGGTLVSDRHVITAAHCVTNPTNQQVMDKSTMIIFLGKHNLRTSVEGVQTKFVSNIIVHEDYYVETPFSRDIAILRLTLPAKFTDRVQPACLWPEDQVDLKHVIGKYGSVVGWGLDQNGLGSEDLMELQIPVIDQYACTKSNLFFQRYTSDYTLCAGFFKQNKSVCNGDSGGGFLLSMDDTWYLRGLVSVSPAKQDGLRVRCDPDHYVVFTDVAKFLPWIKENMV